MNQEPLRDLLRITTAGSVDDGKSTLIGRLLADSGALTTDQIAALTARAAREGSEDIDLAAVTDGLTAEREQGITIDVAYRYFATAKRSFILADVPGHEQYTRNMVTGASKASAALFVVDVRAGMTRQTRRHVCIAALLGLKHVIFAINKMDLVRFDEKAFADLRDTISAFSARLPFSRIHTVPVSAKRGDNVVGRSGFTPWYRGAPLLDLLEALPSSARVGEDRPFRMPVQLVSRPREGAETDFRGYMGRITSGQIRVGEPVRIFPGGNESTVTGITTPGGPARHARAGQSITVTLSDQIDIGRGHMLCDTGNPPRESRDTQAVMCWLDSTPQDPRGLYQLRTGTKSVSARLDLPDSRVNVDSLNTTAGNEPLTLNEIGMVRIRMKDAVAFDPFLENPDTGCFILIDSRTNNTVAAGMFDHHLSSWLGLPKTGLPLS